MQDEVILVTCSKIKILGQLRVKTIETSGKTGDAGVDGAVVAVLPGRAVSEAFVRITFEEGHVNMPAFVLL